VNTPNRGLHIRLVNKPDGKTADSGSPAENPKLWIAGAGLLMAFMVWAAWLNRNQWYAMLAPYGLSSQENHTTYGEFDVGTSYGTGHFALNPLGWIVIVILLPALVAGVWSVASAVFWWLWASSGGTQAVPNIPVPALAGSAAAMVFTILLGLFGRHSSATAAVHVIVTLAAAAAAGCTFKVVMTYATDPAVRFRRVQAFAARADQVLGHGHPKVSRVKTPMLSGWDGDAGHQRHWPRRLICRTGPGWQDKPSEHAALNQYARQVGWPTYTWSYDSMHKQVIGTVAQDGASTASTSGSSSAGTSGSGSAGTSGSGSADAGGQGSQGRRDDPHRRRCLPPDAPASRTPAEAAKSRPPASSAGQPPTAAPDAAPPPVSVPVVAGGYFGVDTHGEVMSASARGAALVIGPPGSGKTQSVIMPSVAYAPGAVVSTSMKAEVLAGTHAARNKRGKCWLFDPGGSTVPDGVIGLRWNPLCDVTDWDSARSVAGRLTGPARDGAGSSSEGSHWIDRAETWLSALLYGARLATDEGDLAALARWCVNPTKTGPECEAILIVAGEDGDEGAEIAATLLDSLLGVPDRERESIASTLGRLMNIYNSAAALRSGINPNFDVHAFVRSNDTVYITAPVDRQRDYAPLIAGFLESVRLAQYHRRQAVDLGNETQTVPVTFVLDEAANTAPIPLPNVVSEAGGQGLHLVVAFQDLSQARARWEKAADGFLTLFPEKLILAGMNDHSTAEMLSKMSGEYDRMTVSYAEQGHNSGGSGATRLGSSTAKPGYSYHTQRSPVLSVADITGVPSGRGLYFGPKGWELLTLNPWWKQRKELAL
jgi:type IV secretion system protein VirD4